MVNSPVNPRRAGLIDPAINNEINLGDTLISEAVRYALLNRCGYDEIVAAPSLRRPTQDEIRLLNDCETVFVGGTNLLSSNMFRYRQWRINFSDVLRLKPVVLLGVGWWQYQRRADWFTRLFLRRLLAWDLYHSVRDAYSSEQLKAAGFRKVINTCCPTMWALQKTPPVRRTQARAVVTTLTCYSKAPEADRRLIGVLCEKYETVHFWPQGDNDMEYLRDIHNGSPPPNICWLDQTVASFDQLLQGERDLDYVGTRLHGGIRALSRGVRTLILSVDNRAKEISRDTNLPVCDRQDTSRIAQLITDGFNTHLQLPLQEIETWCGQFHRAREAHHDNPPAACSRESEETQR